MCCDYIATEAEYKRNDKWTRRNNDKMRKEKSLGICALSLRTYYIANEAKKEERENVVAIYRTKCSWMCAYSAHTVHECMNTHSPYIHIIFMASAVFQRCEWMNEWKDECIYLLIGWLARPLLFKTMKLVNRSIGIRFRIHFRFNSIFTGIFIAIIAFHIWLSNYKRAAHRYYYHCYYCSIITFEISLWRLLTS